MISRLLNTNYVCECYCDAALININANNMMRGVPSASPQCQIVSDRLATLTTAHEFYNPALWMANHPSTNTPINIQSVPGGHSWYCTSQFHQVLRLSHQIRAALLDTENRSLVLWVWLDRK